MVGYHTARGSDSITAAELWYTCDRGQTWQRSAGGESGQNPIAFEAPQDGLFGLYVVLHNANGASAPAPKTGTAPQQWVLVDRAAPIVQVLQLTPDVRFDLNREIHIRWAVRDDNLPNRPVSLHYRCDQSRAFQLIAGDLPANSSFSWTVPDNITGRVEIKISAVDQADNTGRYVADWLRVDGSTVTDSRGTRMTTIEGEQSAPEVAPNGHLMARHASSLTTAIDQPGARPMAPSQRASPDSRGLPHSEPDAGPEPVPGGAAKEAQKCYDLGTWHRLRGEHDVAIARFRDALKLNPALSEARNDLAGLLYLQGDYEGAERELKFILAKDQRHRPALKTLALVQATRHNYRSSAESLEKLLLLDADDAEAWLYLGDIRLFMGERSRAREAWGKAAAGQTASEETRERAQKRLDIYRSDGFPAVPAR
ncbi:MAG TPA: tetratricopeptide repeat protein [Phycisphaerae bacterium]|nr:tetratricopeptide repeat protein [Phycisphaerae bacterium]